MVHRLDPRRHADDGEKSPTKAPQLPPRPVGGRAFAGDDRRHELIPPPATGPPRTVVSELQGPIGCLAPGYAEIFQMSSELIKHVTDDSFDSDVLKADKPVLVDYWAEWCGPCKMIAPILDEVSKTYEGRLQVAKMNVDENRTVPAQHNIRGIPTLMLFKGGVLAATKVGALNKAQLTAFLDGHL
jgi:thioredoxin